MSYKDKKNSTQHKNVKSLYRKEYRKEYRGVEELDSVVEFITFDLVGTNKSDEEYTVPMVKILTTKYGYDKEKHQKTIKENYFSIGADRFRDMIAEVSK